MIFWIRSISVLWMAIHGNSNLFNRVTDDVADSPCRLRLPHSMHSAQGLLFGCRIPLGFKQASLSGDGEI
jgi:hypothetical protein